MSAIHKVIVTNDSFSALALRLPLGIIFAVHAAQKLFGWFGGYGFDANFRCWPFKY